MPDMETDEVPLAEEHQTQEDVDGDVLSKLKDIKKGAAKKRVMKPQPKLDASRLIGERGLPTLLNLFKNVKFKGKGYEAEDLKLMMTRLEHWGHRLFPKMPFDELIERVEKLGGKGEVKTCLKRIRLDMPLVTGDYIEEPEVTDNPPAPEMDELNAEAAYDEMIRQEREMLEKERRGSQIDSDTEDQPTSPVRNKTNPPHSPGAVGKTPTQVADTVTPQTPAAAATPNTSQGLTPDQKKRLELNKLNALKKKAARLGVSLESLLPPKPAESTMSAGESGASQTSSQNSQDGAPVSRNIEDNVNVPSQNDSVDTDMQNGSTQETTNGRQEAQSITESQESKSSSDVKEIQQGEKSAAKSDNNESDMHTEDEILNSMFEDEETTNPEEAGSVSTPREEVQDRHKDPEVKDRHKDPEVKDRHKDPEVKDRHKDPLVDSETERAEGVGSKPLLKVCAEPVLESCVAGEGDPVGRGEGGSVGESGGEGRKGSAGEDLVLEFSDDTNTTLESLQSP